MRVTAGGKSVGVQGEGSGGALTESLGAGTKVMVLCQIRKESVGSSARGPSSHSPVSGVVELSAQLAPGRRGGSPSSPGHHTTLEEGQRECPQEKAIAHLASCLSSMAEKTSCVPSFTKSPVHPLCHRACQTLSPLWTLPSQSLDEVRASKQKPR